MTGQLTQADVTVLPTRWSALPGAAGGSWSPALSPDGLHAAYISDRGGRPQVWVSPVGLLGSAFLINTGSAPVTSVRWSTGGGWLAVQVAPGGGPRHEVWLVRPDGTSLRQVAGFGADDADNMRWLPGRSALVVTENLTTGRLISPAVDYAETVVDGDLLALLDVSGDQALVRLGPRGDRHVFARNLKTLEDTIIVRGEQAVFAPDGTIYARSEHDEYPVLLRVSPSAPALNSWISGGATGELEAFALTADGTSMAMLWNVRGGESAITVVELASGAISEIGPLPGLVVSGLTWSHDGSTLAFTAEGPGQPHGVWVHRDGVIAPVSAAPAVPGAVRPTLEVFSGHDGLPLSGWLWRPSGVGPHPAVIWLHGGPEAQERPGHDPLFQGLVAAGIAVFAPNVRGSSGFGRSFVSADNVGLRYDAISDVQSAVSFLVSSGVGSLFGCMGRSYGGYLTLAALTTYPTLFTVGVDICGMSDFFTFYRHTEPWIAAAAVSKYGDPVADAALLEDLSPLRRIDRLTAPLLVVHGENDTNVPLIEATQVVEALAARGAPHRFLLFPGEGHELLHQESRATFLTETIAWLKDHLLPLARPTFT